MSNGFEFLPRSSRRMGFPKRAVSMFLLVAMVFGGGWLFLYWTNLLAQGSLEKEIEEIHKKNESLTIAIRAMLPKPEVFGDLEIMVKRHNIALIGPRIHWTNLLQDLEAVLPADSVVVKFENSANGQPVFEAGEKDFRLQVMVSSVVTGNSLYKAMLNKKSFASLKMTPQGEQNYQGRQGVVYQIEFNYGGEG